MWNTFGPDQIDLDVRTEVTKRFVKETIQPSSSWSSTRPA
ncbi:Sucrose phosphorylase [Lactobacillus delbrueckii subsp. bulgaricus]|nr:Sucrose phosphorylase [Lactobacillus delbrueckii subsp. bulgaricus]